MQERIYQLREAFAPKKSKLLVDFQVLTEVYRDQILPLMKNFSIELFQDFNLHIANEYLDKCFSNQDQDFIVGGIYNQKLISICMAKSPTKNSLRVSWVYTLAQYRGKGVGSNMIFKLAQEVINMSKKAILYTDLTNPTSNSIYKKIGFKPVIDFDSKNTPLLAAGR